MRKTYWENTPTYVFAMHLHTYTFALENIYILHVSKYLFIYLQ